MITALSLADGTGTDVSLMPSDKVLVTDVDGLWGVESPRQVKRPRPTGHGALNDTRYGDGRLMSVAWDVAGTDQADTLTQFHALTAPMVDTWDVGPAALKWTQAGDARQGMTNLCTNPKAGTDTSAVTATSLPIFERVVLGQSGAPAASGSMPVEVTTSFHCTSDANLDRVAYFANATIGVTYTISAWVYLVSLTASSVGTQIMTGAAPQGTIGGGGATATIGSWVQIFQTVAADATGSLEFRIRQNGAGAAEWYYTGVQIEALSTVGKYFDGDTEYGYWTGTAEASTSTFDASLQRLVKLDSDVTPHVAAGDDKRLVFQAQFFAEDPRAYHAPLQTVTSAALSSASGGLVFNAKFPWKFTPSSGGTVTVNNRGNRKTPPTFRIYGYCINPQVLIVGSSTQVITLSGTIASGDFVDVDVANRTLKYNGTTVQNNLIDSASTNWFELARGVSRLQMTAGTFDANAKVAVSWRDAYA